MHPLGRCKVKCVTRLDAKGRVPSVNVAYDTIDPEHRRRMRIGEQGGTLRAFARIDNVLDQRHIGSVIVNDGNQRFFEPGPDRRYNVGLQWQWAP